MGQSNIFTLILKAFLIELTNMTQDSGLTKFAVILSQKRGRKPRFLKKPQA